MKMIVISSLKIKLENCNIVKKIIQSKNVNMDSIDEQQQHEKTPLLQADYLQPPTQITIHSNLLESSQPVNLSLHSILVTHFDTRRGNRIEFGYPNVKFLDGVEFKSLASGMHTVEKDFV